MGRGNKGGVATEERCSAVKLGMKHEYTVFACTGGTVIVKEGQQTDGNEFASISEALAYVRGNRGKEPARVTFLDATETVLFTEDV